MRQFLQEKSSSELSHTSSFGSGTIFIVCGFFGVLLNTLAIISSCSRFISLFSKEITSKKPSNSLYKSIHAIQTHCYFPSILSPQISGHALVIVFYVYATCMRLYIESVSKLESNQSNSRQTFLRRFDFNLMLVIPLVLLVVLEIFMTLAEIYSNQYFIMVFILIATLLFLGVSIRLTISQFSLRTMLGRMSETHASYLHRWIHARKLLKRQAQFVFISDAIVFLMFIFVIVLFCVSPPITLTNLSHKESQAQFQQLEPTNAYLKSKINLDFQINVLAMVAELIMFVLMCLMLQFSWIPLSFCQLNRRRRRSNMPNFYIDTNTGKQRYGIDGGGVQQKVRRIGLTPPSQINCICLNI